MALADIVKHQREPYSLDRAVPCMKADTIELEGQVAPLWYLTGVEGLEQEHQQALYGFFERTVLTDVVSNEEHSGIRNAILGNLTPEGAQHYVAAFNESYMDWFKTNISARGLSQEYEVPFFEAETTQANGSYHHEFRLNNSNSLFVVESTPEDIFGSFERCILEDLFSDDLIKDIALSGLPEEAFRYHAERFNKTMNPSNDGIGSRSVLEEASSAYAYVIETGNLEKAIDRAKKEASEFPYAGINNAEQLIRMGRAAFALGYSPGKPLDVIVDTEVPYALRYASPGCRLPEGFEKPKTLATAKTVEEVAYVGERYGIGKERFGELYGAAKEAAQSGQTSPGQLKKLGSKKGFTLIELLTVIGIIAILAGILFPVFSRAREKARQTACLSNVKQIGTAMQMYAQDYDDFLPLNIANPGNPTNQIWGATGFVTGMGLLQPYIKNLDIMFCPSANYWTIGNPTHGKQNWGQTGPGKNVNSSYVYRESGCGASYTIDSQLNEGKVFAVDANHQYKDGRFSHADGMNALYNDGHVKFVPDPGGARASKITSWDDFFAIVD